MCIRDSGKIIQELERSFRGANWNVIKVIWSGEWDALFAICLLYTSDAADERSSVDLGGRRIIKKKTIRL